MSAQHVCSKCGHSFPLNALPTAETEIFESTKVHSSLSDYIYVVCPNCGKKDWATERRFFGFLGPKGLYGLLLLFLAGFLVAIFFATIST